MGSRVDGMLFPPTHRQAGPHQGPGCLHVLPLSSAPQPGLTLQVSQILTGPSSAQPFNPPEMWALHMQSGSPYTPTLYPQRVCIQTPKP